MNALDVIWEKECCNEGSIYLYCLENSWRAFGHSAFYLSLLYPGLEVVKCDNRDITKICACISYDYLMEIFEVNQIYVGNEYIEMKAPERVCCEEDEYIKWCNQLFGRVEWKK